MDKFTDMVNFDGLIILIIKEIGKIMSLMDLESIFGMTVESMLATGNMTKCMEKEKLSMKMEDSIKVNLKMDLNTDKANIFGLTVNSTMVHGNEESSMAEACSRIQKV